MIVITLIIWRGSIYSVTEATPEPSPPNTHAWVDESNPATSPEGTTGEDRLLAKDSFARIDFPSPTQ